MNKLFVFKEKENAYTKELAMAYECLKDQAEVSKIMEKELTVDLLEQKKIDIVISNGLSREWFFTLKGLKCPTIVFDNNEQYSQLSDITIDYKSTDTNKYFTGSNCSLTNPNFVVEEITDLVSIMKWDSDFFGFNVAYVSCRNLSENILFKINGFIKKNNIRLIEYLCNCHDDRSVKVAEKNDFHFTDIRLTFDLPIAKKDDGPLPAGMQVKPSVKGDIDLLKQLTENMYKDSRYYYDGNFDLEKINEFYSSWIEKAVLGTFDNICYALYHKEKPIGFCTIKYGKENTANIGLFGMDPSYAGKGLGKLLLQNVCNLLADRGTTRLFVVTQGRNYAAQRLYQSVGFKTTSTQLWYHKWI